MVGVEEMNGDMGEMMGDGIMLGNGMMMIDPVENLENGERGHTDGTTEELGRVQSSQGYGASLWK